MEVPDLDNKDAELKVEDCSSEKINLSPQFSEIDIKKVIENEKLKYVTIGGKMGVLGKAFFSKISGEKEDEGKDVKVTPKGELRKTFWLTQGVYLCNHVRKGSPEKYQLSASKNVERVWIDGKEIPLAIEELKASNLASKLMPKNIGIGFAGATFELPVDLDIFCNLLDKASEKFLAELEIQDKTILKSGKLVLPNVVEQVWDIKPFVFVHDDDTGQEIKGSLKKKLIETLSNQNKGKPISKTKMKSEKIINEIKDKVCILPKETPRKILERSLKVNKMIAFSVPFYQFKIDGRGKVTNLYVNAITKNVHQDSIS